ncbi:MAG: glycosyltransferase family 29 protein [Paracoccaceae bacterium]
MAGLAASGLFERLSFAWQRRGNGRRLEGRYAPQAEILGAMAGKNIAIVGNARALSKSQQGAQIDRADLVVRINRAPMPSTASHGSRTDWLALATGLPDQERARIAPGRLLWMSHKRKRLRAWMAASAGFYLHPLADYRALAQSIGAPPTTGAMLIDLAAKSQAQSIALYGFDFFASLSLSGSRTAAQTPHDFSAEAAWANTLIAADPRLTLHTME